MLKFNNGKFKIMQISDVQDTKKTDPDTVRFIDCALKREKPDVIVFTGDQIDVVGLWGKGEKCLKNVRKAIYGVFSSVDSNGIPFAVTFGNHDCETGVPNVLQEEIYREFENCINGKDSVVTGPGSGTLCIPVFNTDGEKALNVILIDTGSGKASGEYAGPAENQLDWYSELESENPVPSVVFQHIPPGEIYELFEESGKSEKDALPAFGTRKGKFFTLKRERLKEFVCIGETPSTLSASAREFELMRRKGDVFGIFFGHDHYNGFVGNVRGIDLGYCPGAGYNTYGPFHRAVRVFEFDESDVRNYRTYTVNYKDCCDKALTAPLKNVLFSNAPSSTGEAKSFALKTLLKIAALCLLLMLADKLTGGAAVPLIPVAAAILFAVYLAVMGIRRKIIRDRYLNGFGKEK